MAEDSDEDFEEQLRMEARAKQLEEDSGQSTGEKLEQGRTKVDPDGTVYEWDAAKKAWFPKIDDDFIAQYQMNYGSNAAPSTQQSSTEAGSQEAADHKAYWDYYHQYYAHYYASQSANTSESTTEATQSASKDSSNEQYDEDYWNSYYQYYGQQTETQGEQNSAETQGEPSQEAEKTEEKKEENEEKEGGKGDGKKRKKDEAGWFDVDEEKTTNVYVSGLPPDITDDEFREFMTKCGLLLYDHVTKKLKIKLYKDADGNNKGDGLCGYIKPESVDLALQILDGSELRGHTVSVQRAKFTLKGDYDPSKKRRKLTNKQKRRLKEKQEKLFDWRPDKLPGERPRSDRIVIIKCCFVPQQFEKDPSQINILSQKVRSMCSKYGDVKKVKVHDCHPEGVVAVTMGTPEDADLTTEGVNGTVLGGRQLEAFTWDGKTKYDVKETEEEIKARDAQWEKFLLQQEADKSSKKGDSKPQESQNKPENEKESGNKE